MLSAGDGTVEIAGAVNTDSTAVGGVVKIAGSLIDVQGTADISASGENGGGVIEIGGGYQGASMGEGLSNSIDTRVAAGATISADAGSEGDGGRVVVWSEERTSYEGSISATGGAQGGDGGLAEVSGKQQLGFDGTVDLSADNGETGTLLLDPDNIVIDVANGDDGELADSQILAGDGGAATFTISPAALATSVGTANTIIQANDTITQNAGSPIDLSGGAANSLSMTTTTGDITLNDTFTGSGGDVNLDAGGSVVLNDALSNSGDLNITATEITSGVSGSIVVSGATDLQSTGPITLDNSGNDFGGCLLYTSPSPRDS